MRMSKNLKRKFFFKKCLLLTKFYTIFGNMRMKVFFFVFGAVDAPPDKTRYRRERLNT